MIFVNVFFAVCIYEWNLGMFSVLLALLNEIDDVFFIVMLSMLRSSAVDRGFEPRSGQTKDYANCICCFSAKHAALRGKIKGITSTLADPNPNPSLVISL